jgi:hypothetical protein
MTPRAMNAELAVHSARAVPIVPDGWKMPNGYELRGPRGHRVTISAGHDGDIPPNEEARLRRWLTSIADGDKMHRRAL